MLTFSNSSAVLLHVTYSYCFFWQVDCYNEKQAALEKISQSTPLSILESFQTSWMQWFGCYQWCIEWCFDSNSRFSVVNIVSNCCIEAVNVSSLFSKHQSICVYIILLHPLFIQCNTPNNCLPIRRSYWCPPQGS